MPAQIAAHILHGMSDRALDYIRHVMDKMDVTASKLAELAGVSSTTITRPLNDPDHPHGVSRRTLEKIEAASGIPFGGGNTLPAMSRQADVMIPIYDVAASAGPGTYVDYEMVADQLAFPPDYLRKITSTPPTRLAIISVNGDSMEPTLKDDDIVMVDGTKTSPTFDGLFVMNIDGTLHVKRLARTGKPGMVMIRSDNAEKYPAYEVKAEDVHVVGKVLWSGRKE